jgi:hypothetical protein
MQLPGFLGSGKRWFINDEKSKILQEQPELGLQKWHYKSRYNSDIIKKGTHLNKMGTPSFYLF